MKKVIPVILSLIIVVMAYGGHMMIKRERKNINYVSLKINENIYELDRYITNLKSDYANQASLNREYVHLEMTVNQLDADIDTLKFLVPELNLRLDEMISHYAHLMEKRVYGIDRHRATELLDELNVYIQLYADSDLYSSDSTYETILMRDEYINEKISELGSERYRNLCMEIMSVR